MKIPGDKTIQLHPSDNVVVCIQSIEAGEQVWLDGSMVTVSKNIGLGHKLAIKNIANGETIIKYGVPVGSAISNIAKGEHVHTHNIKSNYIPTEKQETFL